MVVSHDRFEGEIGRGGMGIVYGAVDTSLGHRVAIRVLPSDTAGDPERIAASYRKPAPLPR